MVSIRGVDDERMSCISRYNCGNINRVNRAKLYPRSVYKFGVVSPRIDCHAVPVSTMTPQDKILIGATWSQLIVARASIVTVVMIRVGYPVWKF